MDKAGIIHMNGRIYDPVMGRFLQADPFIQEPDNTQSLNRYSYVINNPLSYTDPSGYFFNSVFSAVFQGIVVAAGCSVGSFVGCGVAGFVSNIALGQTLRQSVINGAVSGLQAVAFDKVGALAKAGDINSYAAFAIHGAIGAASAAAQGGDPLSAFLSSSLSKVFSLTAQGILEGVENSAVEAVVVGVIGGTVSELTGGNFANGAVTAAFGYLVNQKQALKNDIDNIIVGLDGAGSDDLYDNQAIAALASELGAKLFDAKAVTGSPIDEAVGYILEKLSQSPSAKVYLFGYSAGGHGAIGLAEALNEKGIPVQGLVTFDAHHPARLFGSRTYDLTPNVARAINFYQHKSAFFLGRNQYKGGVVNCMTCSVDPNIDLSNTSVLHTTVVQYVLKNYKPLVLDGLGR